MGQLKYRSDIDGLRAVAVLGVVIYHAFPWVIPGGFIGVDIFFVISGYLISGILYKGHKEGNFSFKEFYARRVRRLFPALITVLLATMAYGWLILLPDEFQQLGKHVAAGTLFIQNIVFWQESGYFDTAANLKPLLHLWSLAVEEQFYIFFPPILLLIWKRKWPLAAMMGVLLLASMIGNLVMSYQNSASDFFLTPYRAWEFLGGSLLAWWHYDRGHEEDVPHYREVLSIGGGILLVLGMGLIHKETPYPGWRALLPVAGTLMLMEGGREAWVNRKILSNPAVVWIGLISYPLYLFHWPALSFVHIVKGESPKPVYCADALIVSLVLSTFTFYFIEKKLRHNKSQWVLPALVGAFVAVGIIGHVIEEQIIPARCVPLCISGVLKAVNDRKIMQGLTWMMPDNDNIWINRGGGNGAKTLFVGDSNMQQYGARIASLVGGNCELNRGVVFITAGGVLPIAGCSKETGRKSDDLLKKSHELFVNDPTVDRVVIAAHWLAYFNNVAGYQIGGISLGDKAGLNEAMKQLGINISNLVNNGKNVYLILSIPSGWELDPKKIYPRTFQGKYADHAKALTKKSFLEQHGALLSEIALVARKNGAKVIDPLDYLCTNGVCIAEDENGIPIRYDENHLRSGYVREHVKYLDETVAP